MRPLLSGVVASPVTPLTADGRIDDATFARLLRFLVREGADHVAVPMHIGESLKLSDAERRRLVEIAAQTLDPATPLYAHVSTPGTELTIALARHAIAAGAAGVVVTPPYHWRPSPAALVEHFTAVAAATAGQVIGYNYPERIGVTVSPEVVAEVIATSPNFVGLKDASLTMKYFTEVCRVGASLRPGFAVFSGVEYVLPAAAIGGAGCFSACGGVAPRLVRRLADAALAGDLVAARPLQATISELFSAIETGYPATIKAAMAIMGRPCGPSRLPAERLSLDDMKRLESRLDDLDVLESEPHGWE
ncbi:dihydrodipicolinate synthase family protein [Jiangella ureilytica]|uniref:dihydrodipicolinate synthase family protein n=1 Tax=Jiangella ureilytica TaxID=2530374 RepID=UPI0013A5F289|nr:dihydrodipicolinate synthase family protein [Jiangella ureilytica]